MPRLAQVSGYGAAPSGILLALHDRGPGTGLELPLFLPALFCSPCAGGEESVSKASFIVAAESPGLCVREDSVNNWFYQFAS